MVLSKKEISSFFLSTHRRHLEPFFGGMFCLSGSWCRYLRDDMMDYLLLYVATAAHNCCTQAHTQAHTHTHRGLDLEILNHGESVISSYVLAPPPYMDHHQHWACTCDTGYGCERFIPLQCCCAGEASRTPSVKAWLRNSAPSSLFKLEKCFNFLF